MNLFKKLNNKKMKLVMVMFLLVVVLVGGWNKQTHAQAYPLNYVSPKMPEAEGPTAAELNSLYFSTNIKTGTYVTTANNVRESMSLGNTQGLALDVNNMSGVAVTYGDYIDSIFKMKNSLFSPVTIAAVGLTLKYGGSPVSPSEIAGTIANNTIFKVLGKDMTEAQNKSNQNLMNLKQSIYDSVQDLFNDPSCVQKMRDAHNMYQGQDNYQSIIGCVKKVTDNSTSALSNYYQKTETDPEKLNQRLNSLNLMQSGNTKASKEAPGKAEGIYCFRWLDGISVPGCIAIFSYFILYLTSWVLFVAALFFDFSISYTLGMYDIVNSFNFIQYGWETLRNFVNLFFILILVYISIATILQLENYGYKKLLGKLVVAAFLINFSMFFTQIIIDASNITTLVFYKQIMTEAKGEVDKISEDKTSSGGALAAAKAGNQYISLGIMNALGLQSVWGVVGNNGGVKSGSSNKNTDPANGGIGGQVAETGKGGVLNPWTMTLVGLGGSVFVLILAFIFLAAGAMFVLRLVMLILLMVTSPIAFAARVLPKTSSQSDKWWKHLISNALFAPVYMMLMFVTLKMIWGGDNKVNNLLSLFTGEDASSINVIFFFVLLCAMLVLCLVAASSIGSWGSKTIHGWGKSMGTKAKNVAINRATAPVSRFADAASRSTLLGKMATSDSAIGRFIGGRTLQRADKLAQSKLGGSSSYRDRVKAGQKEVESRAKLAEGNIKKRAGESDMDYYNRTGYRDGELKKKKNESDPDYNRRMTRLGFNINALGYKDDNTMKADVSKAYGVVTNSSGDLSLKGSYFSRGDKQAAMSRIEDLGKKAKEKKSSASEQLERIKLQLYRKAGTVINTTTGTTLASPDGELLKLRNYLRTSAPSHIANQADTIFNSTTDKNTEDKALEMKSLFEVHRNSLMADRQILKEAVKRASTAATAMSLLPGVSPEEKQNTHNNFERKSNELALLQADIDEFDKTKAGLTAHLSKIDELNIMQSQLEAASKPSAPTTP